MKMTSTGSQYKWIILLAFGVAGWAYCGALIGIGRQFLPMDEVLIIHAIGAPLGFALISYIYFRKLAFTSPLWTAAILTGIVLGLDLFVVAPLFEHSFAMFRSPLGTWIPLASIFAAVYLAGLAAQPKARTKSNLPT